MLSTTIFHLGPFKICFWNIIFLSIIYLIAFVLRRLIHRGLKNYFKSANISIEGRRITWLKLVSQSVYLVAIYFALLSFRFNNESISLMDFLNYRFINLKSFNLTFYHVLVIVVVFIGTRMMVNLTKLYLTRTLRNNAKVDNGTEYVYIQISAYFIYLAAFLITCQILEINLTLILTGSVGILVGLGLGLQDVFKDIIAGVVLLVEGNIRIGDIVEVSGTSNQSSILAKILKINARTTQIETREGNVLIIPNTRLTQQQVENWTHGSELTRFSIDLLVEYGSNTELVSKLLVEAALAHPKVKKNEPVFVRLESFSDNGLAMELIFWADHSWDINNYKSDIRFEIDRLFRQHNIVIPYPKRSVEIKNQPFLSKPDSVE